MPLATFVLPDMDDPPTPILSADHMELEEDDLEWQKWLSDLFDPTSMLSSVSELEETQSMCFAVAPTNMNDSVMSGGTGKEDGDDPEYNYLADQLDEEKEEFRDDRAVRISSRSH